MDGDIDPGVLERPLAPALPPLFCCVRGPSRRRALGMAQRGHGCLRHVGSHVHCGPVEAGHGAVLRHDGGFFILMGLRVVLECVFEPVAGLPVRA
jgi:hypothetical protein